ncbi:DUF317 domain-containing protein [Streptomyces sp. NPDC059037]|uniref:DUF317 domain-containing protein n=1 Tax=Streptomyces sp. NPDC059037 TaxID=3346710 RepID=UPI00367E2F35
MPDTAPDAHVHLALHPQHPSAVVATLTGNTLHTARATLASEGFRPASDDTMLLVRIDHEEPYYANITANLLRDTGITVDISYQLQEEIDTEWTWADHPMTWLDRDGIRLVSADAQKIHDDIQSGRLTIHLYAHDGHTTVAVGTYQHAESVHLHGENHLRVVSGSYDTPGEAIADFERLYGDAVRPGPPPPTDTEQQAAQALAGMSTSQAAIAADAPGKPAVSKTELVPVYAADPGDHEGLLDKFLEEHGEWEKYRTWSDDTTHAVHESLVLRAEFVHEADPDDPQWKIAAYESPVDERLWHATASTTVPVEIMRVLLDSLASADAAQIAAGSQVSEAAIGEATRPLADAGWEQTVDGRWIRWQAPEGHPVGVQFDAFAAHSRNSGLPAWTFWSGDDAGTPQWALHFSSHSATSVLQDVAFEVTQGLAQKPATARRRGLNALSRTDIRAQPAPRAGSSRSQ